MRLHLLLLFCLLTGLTLSSACTNVPELEETVTDDLRAARYPALVPLDSALIARAPKGDEAEDLKKYLTARRDGLQRRAQALGQRAALDEETRRRMQGGVSR